MQGTKRNVVIFHRARETMAPQSTSNQCSAVRGPAPRIQKFYCVRQGTSKGDKEPQ